jgi:hypothetical protein
MTQRILATLAILAGLAAAPGAQTFRWQAGGNEHLRVQIDERIAERVARSVERAWRSVERAAERASRDIERAFDERFQSAEREAQRIRVRAERHVNDHVRRLVRRHVDSHDWAFGGQGQFDEPCRDNDRGDRDGYRHCEVREERLPAGPLTVDAGPNGGVRVEGWDRNEILIRAEVRARAEDEARAKQLASGVQIQAGGGRVSATGPDSSSSREEWWSVNYRINVPRRTDLDLSAHNGGISIADVSGNIRFDTTNGGVRLTDLAGLVRGGTRNGGLTVNLAGSSWDGEGIDVETSNGGVTLSIPDNYNAQLETRTENGGFRFDYPLTLTGELTPRRGISTTIGAGGPPVRVRTTNGGLRIQRR